VTLTRGFTDLDYGLVLPIVEAKRAQPVKSDFALNESIQFVPTTVTPTVR